MLCSCLWCHGILVLWVCGDKVGEIKLEILTYACYACYDVGNCDMSNTRMGYSWGQSFHDFLCKRPA